MQKFLRTRRWRLWWRWRWRLMNATEKRQNDSCESFLTNHHISWCMYVHAHVGVLSLARPSCNSVAIVEKRGSIKASADDIRSRLNSSVSLCERETVCVTSSQGTSAACREWTHRSQRKILEYTRHTHRPQTRLSHVIKWQHWPCAVGYTDLIQLHHHDYPSM